MQHRLRFNPCLLLLKHLFLYRSLRQERLDQAFMIKLAGRLPCNTASINRDDKVDMQATVLSSFILVEGIMLPSLAHFGPVHALVRGSIHCLIADSIYGLLLKKYVTPILV